MLSHGVGDIPNILANLYFVEEFFSFYLVTFKSVENLEKLSCMANITNIILPYDIVTFCKGYLTLHGWFKNIVLYFLVKNWTKQHIYRICTVLNPILNLIVIRTVTKYKKKESPFVKAKLVYKFIILLSLYLCKQLNEFRRVTLLYLCLADFQ